MKRGIFLIVLFCVLAACGSLRQAATPPTQVERDTLYLIFYDTVVRSFPLYILDTTFQVNPDSVTLETPSSTTTVLVEYDTVWRYRINTVVKNDTVFLENHDTVVIEKKIPIIPEIPDVSEPSILPWWLVVVLSLVMGYLGYELRPIRRKTKK